jgi:hypothetical protein
MSRLLLFCLLCFSAGPFSARAGAAPRTSDDPEEDSEPALVQTSLLGELAYPQEAGELQISLLPGLVRDASLSAELPLEVEFGLHNRLQIGASFSALLGENALPSAGLSLLAQPIRRERVEFSLFAEFAHEFSTQENELEAGLVAAVVLGKGALHLSGIVQAEEEGAQVSAVASYFRCLGALCPMVEAGSEFSAEGVRALVSPALLWHPGRAWELGLGAPLSFGETSEQRLVAVLVWERSFQGED